MTMIPMVFFRLFFGDRIESGSQDYLDLRFDSVKWTLPSYAYGKIPYSSPAENGISTKK